MLWIFVLVSEWEEERLNPSLWPSLHQMSHTIDYKQASRLSSELFYSLMNDILSNAILCSYNHTGDHGCYPNSSVYMYLCLKRD
jgi:hypothetical protein